MFKSDIKSNRYPCNVYNKILTIRSHTNELLFNESKSAHMHLGKELGSHTYVLNGSIITSESCIKDLGVYLSTNINFVDISYVP